MTLHDFLTTSYYKLYNIGSHIWSLWRNRLARQTVNLKVGGSSPPRDVSFCPHLLAGLPCVQQPVHNLHIIIIFSTYFASLSVGLVAQR